MAKKKIAAGSDIRMAAGYEKQKPMVAKATKVVAVKPKAVAPKVSKKR